MPFVSSLLIRRLAVPSLTLVLATLASVAMAQGANIRASQFYEDALQRFDKKDYAGAAVQLKSVLQLDPKNISAQVLLGRALLEDGQVNAAEVALAEAIKLGVNRAEVVVPMATAAMRQGKPEAILNDVAFATEGLPREPQFEVLLMKASAATDLGEFKLALKSIEDARALKPNDPSSFRAEVPPRIRMRQLKEALIAADRAVALDPNGAESHFVRGEVLHVVPDPTKAMAAYDKTLALDPAHIGALVTRAGLHMDANRLDAAARDVAEALKKSPREPRSLYLKALIAEREGRSAEAKAALNDLTAQIDVIPLPYLRYRPQTLMLGGLAHHGLGQREKAKPYLEGVLQKQPGNGVAKVLANIHLADRNVDAAINVLDSYLRAVPGDNQALLLVANAHLTQGRAARSVQILQDALKRKDTLELRSALGLSLVGAGRYAEALRELEGVFAKNPKLYQPAFALASLYTQSGQGVQALRVAQSLDRNFPKNARVLDLTGQAQRLRGDLVAARSAFEAAAAADPAFSAPRINLARLDMANGDHAAAAKTLDAVIAREDRNVDAVATIAELFERSGKLVDAERWYSRADEIAGADNPMPALALLEFQLRQRQVPKAREALNRALAKAPDAVLTQIAAGRVALAAGDSATARAALSRAAASAGFNVPQLTQVASLLLEAGAASAAAHALDKALIERPDHVPALTLRAGIDIRGGELNAAEARVKRIQTLLPRSGLGAALAGDLAMARKQPDAALAAYRKAHELDRSSASMMRLFAAIARRDRSAAIRLAEQWVATNPRDAVVWRALADTQFNARNLVAARRSYEAVEKLGVPDADALNNLAQVLMLQKDAGALLTAERALALAPTAPHVIGTAGWAAYQAGQNDRAIQLLRDARLRDPANADTRYYLASVLAAMGRATEARTELVAALESNSNLSYRAEAEKLLATLR